MGDAEKTVTKTLDRKAVLSHARRVVVKLGTAVLMKDEGGIALSRFYSFIEDIAKLKKSGREILLVTSGAVGLGVQKLGLGKRPKELPLKQACAAVGQGRLMALYSDAFATCDVTTAQILLTEDDFANRKRYLNLRSTIMELLQLQVLPIINENDTVSTAELEVGGSRRKVNFGDNDKLSALVASKVEADLLLILTDVDGLYTSDPRLNPDARLIGVVDDISPEFEDRVLGAGETTRSGVGRGGMRTKLEAAKVAAQSGCSTIVVGGKSPSVISRIFEGEDLGTLFLPKQGMTGKLRWIAFATSISASVVVNDGAKSALLKKKASLLPAGVTEVRGKFNRGDVISIVDASGKEFARGIANYSSVEAEKIAGMQSTALDEMVEHRNYDALVTRDNVAFFDSER